MADFPPVAMTDNEDSKYFRVKHRDNSVSAEMEDGYEISRPRSTRRPGRIFSTGFTFITDADKELLESFWENVAVANANMFSWVIPTSGQEIMVKFKGELDFTYVGIGGHNRWDVKFELKEI